MRIKYGVVLLCLLLGACASDGGVATQSRRFLSLRHPQSGESVAVTYVQNYHYDSSALERLNWIFRDRRNNKTARIDPKLLDFIADLRDKTGLPENVTFDILSGYRSPETNVALARTNRSVARESWHMKGKAVDLRVPFVAGQAMAEIAKTLQRGGVAFYPKSSHVHIDTGGVRTWRVQ
jgi:uncharacterized protein YcbK (DUF882 family)